jgi:hypothetical protein
VSAIISSSRGTVRIGHAAAFTLTLTNSGTQPLDIGQLTSGGSFTLSQGSKVIWRSTKTVLHARGVQSLAPGQSVVLHGRWSGKPNHHRFESIEPGVYQLAATAGGFTAETTIRLTR